MSLNRFLFVATLGVTLTFETAIAQNLSGEQVAKCRAAHLWFAQFSQSSGNYSQAQQFKMFADLGQVYAVKNGIFDGATFDKYVTIASSSFTWAADQKICVEGSYLETLMLQ